MARVAGLLLVGILLGVLGTWAVQAGLNSGPSSSSGSSGISKPSRSETTAKRSIHALGTIEPKGGPVLVTSALVGTKIRSLLVREGQLVKQGDPLIELDPTVAEHELQIAKTQRGQAEERQKSEVTLARQRLEGAQLALSQAEATRGPELSTQRMQGEVAQLKLQQARDDLKRLESLVKGDNPLASSQQVEQQSTLVKLAEAEREAAATGLKRLENSLSFNLQRAQGEQKSAQEGLAIAERGTALATFDRQIQLAEHKLKLTTVTAPADGTVTSVLAHAGELVGTQPLMQIANLQALECLAEVDVADLPLLKDRSEALVSCRAFRGTKIKAKIERTRNLAGAATLRPVDPRKAVDRTVATLVLSINAVEAAQLLGSSLQDTGTALMGLQVDVEIPL